MPHSDDYPSDPPHLALTIEPPPLDLNDQPRKARIAPLLALVLLVNLAASLYQLPLNRVIERRLCLEYYREHDPSAIGPGGDVTERLCKIDSVQQDLAWIQGAMETTWIVGDFIMTIPLGFMAEVYGRRVILCLNLVPRIAMSTWAVVVGHFQDSLPTTAILASPFLSILGGDCVFNSITYALAAGMSDDYVTRATYFGWMGSVSYVVALLGPALASATMSLLLWLPFWAGTVLLLLAIPTVFHLEGPRPPLLGLYSGAAPSLDHDDQSRPLLSSPLLKAQDSAQSIVQSITQRFQAFHSILANYPHNLNLLLLSFLLTALASSDTKLLVQYISKRYSWSFASTGYLLSAKALVNFTLLTFVIPRILREGRRAGSIDSPGDATHRVNMHYANLCLFVSIAGALAIASAFAIWVLIPSLFIYALGSALPVFTLSLLKSPYIAPEQVDPAVSIVDADSSTFSIVMMVKTAGSLLGAPLMATLWVEGIGVGGVALGLPYVVSAACYLAAVFVLSRIKTVAR